MSNEDVPQIDSKEELAAYGVKNWYKVIALFVSFTLCILLIVGSILYFVKKTDTKVTTPIISVEHKK